MVTHRAPQDTPARKNRRKASPGKAGPAGSAAPPVADEIARFRARLIEAARGAGRALGPFETEALVTHYRLLRQWGSRMNLTGLKDEEPILRRHFVEPIAASDLLGDAGTLLDIGSGNGFPAIPLKVLHPGLALVLVEASEKKSAFLRAVLRELGLEDSRVETRRIESAADLSDLLPCRYLTLRAVRGRDLLESAGGRHLLEPGGRALLFVSADEAVDLRRRPIRGLRWQESRPLPSGKGSAVVVMAPEP